MKSKTPSVILPVILTILSLILVWYLVAPAYKEARAEKESLEIEVLSLQEKLDWLDSTNTELKSGEATFSKLFVSVPSEDRDEPNTLAEIEAIALKHNLVIPSIGISDSTLDDTSGLSSLNIPANKVSITVSSDGSFADLSAFIASIENSVKFMNIKGMTFTTGENTEASLSLEIEGYTSMSSDVDQTGVDEGV